MKKAASAPAAPVAVAPMPHLRLGVPPRRRRRRHRPARPRRRPDVQAPPDISRTWSAKRSGFVPRPGRFFGQVVISFHGRSAAVRRGARRAGSLRRPPAASEHRQRDRAQAAISPRPRNRPAAAALSRAARGSRGQHEPLRADLVEVDLHPRAGPCSSTRAPRPHRSSDEHAAAEVHTSWAPSPSTSPNANSTARRVMEVFRRLLGARGAHG